MKRLFLLALISLALSTLYGLPFLGFDIGLSFVINAENAAAPNPIILQELGLTLPILAEGIFYLDTGLLLAGGWYQYLGSRALWADIERADTIWALSLQLNLGVGIKLDLTDHLQLGATLGPALIFPLPLLANDAGSQYLDDMYQFFYSNLKFFYAYQEFFLRWLVLKEFNLTFKLRTLYPLAALWDLPDISRLNGLSFQGLVSLELKFAE